jgi:3',5'-cyclic AMP phosphodiesterase CpdA
VLYGREALHWRDALAETFCGRDELLNTIEAGLSRGDSFIVIGQRGMGKTMLLREICGRRDDGQSLDPVCLTVQVSGRETSSFMLDKRVIDSLACRLSLGKPDKQREIKIAVDAKISSTTERPIVQAIQIASSLVRRPVAVDLFLDDVHRLHGQPWAEDWLASLEYQLFSRRQDALRLRVVFSGDVRIRDLLRNLPFSDLYQRLRDVWLEPLSTIEVASLLERLGPQKPPGNSEAIAVLLGDWAGGHPSLTQYLLRDLSENLLADPSQVLETSSARFLAELSKMFDGSWSALDESTRSLIQDVLRTAGPSPQAELLIRLSTGKLKFATARRKALASAFVRVSDGCILQPGKVISRWLSEGPLSVAATHSTAVVSARHHQGSGTTFPTIVHLSDLHFGDGGHAWDQPGEIFGVGRPLHDRVSLLSTLVKDLEEQRNGNAQMDPKVVVVSGDLLFQCRKDGIKPAIDFLSALSAGLGIDRSSVVLCPGNHEQNRTLLTEEPKAQFASYVELWNGFYPSQFRRLPLEWSPGKLVHVYRVENLEILSLNSCEDLRAGPDPDSSHLREQGYVGLQQLREAEALLNGEEPPEGCVRVAVLHHHLSQYQWTTGVDYSILREVERVVNWLRQYNFDLVLHGHQHCVGLHTRVMDKRYLTILAGGSAGVVAKHRWRGGMPLMYQMVCGADVDQAMRICRSFDLIEERWVPNQHEKQAEFPLGFLQ